MKIKRFLNTSAPAATILIRLMVGAVFLSEGIQKFLFPGEVGAGRFAKIGFDSPELTAGVVGTVEITCGSLVLLGIFTRAAVIPLIVIMLTAMTMTKLPILAQQGFWKMAHESRTDWSMLLGSLFLFFVGSGPLAIDAYLSSNAVAESSSSNSKPEPK